MNDLHDVGMFNGEVGIAFERDQLRYTFEPVAPTSRETRSSLSGTMTLHHEWRVGGLGEDQVLRRIVLEGNWHDGPAFMAEARRPRGGWRGDELGRLILWVLSFGMLQ